MPETDTDILVLVLAALFKENPALTIKYSTMAELSDSGRTATAYEHKVRVWRKRAQELLAGTKGEGGAVATPATRKRGRGKKDEGDTAADDEDATSTKPKKAPAKRPAKKAKKDDAAITPSASMSYEFEDGNGNVVKPKEEEDDESEA